MLYFTFHCSTVQIEMHQQNMYKIWILLLIITTSQSVEIDDGRGQNSTRGQDLNLRPARKRQEQSLVPSLAAARNLTEVRGQKSVREQKRKKQVVSKTPNIDRGLKTVREENRQSQRRLPSSMYLLEWIQFMSFLQWCQLLFRQIIPFVVSWHFSR